VANIFKLTGRVITSYLPVAASADPAAAQAVAALGLAAVAAFLLICRVLTLLIHVVLLVVLLLHNSSPSVEVNNKRLLAVLQA
jgi:hypothetical protein